jgi:hypothetical protein
VRAKKQVEFDIVARCPVEFVTPELQSVFKSWTEIAVRAALAEHKGCYVQAVQFWQVLDGSVQHWVGEENVAGVEDPWVLVSRTKESLREVRHQASRIFRRLDPK